MISCVYAITHTASGKQYVGASKNYERRKQYHQTELRKNTHHSVLLQRSYNKYGLDAFNFSILEHVEPGSLAVKEQEWITRLKPVFNASLNVYGHSLGKKLKPLTEEHKEKIRAKNKGVKRPPLSDDQKAKMSAALTGRKQSEATKQKIGASQAGKPRAKHTEETKAKMRAAHASRMYKPFTEEHKANIRAAKNTEEAKKKISETSKAMHAIKRENWKIAPSLSIH